MLVVDKKHVIAGAAVIILAIAGYKWLAGPDDYMGCLGQNMENAKTDAAARAISSACKQKYGVQMYDRQSNAVSDAIKNMTRKDEVITPVAPKKDLYAEWVKNGKVGPSPNPYGEFDD